MPLKRGFREAEQTANYFMQTLFMLHIFLNIDAHESLWSQDLLCFLSVSLPTKSRMYFTYFFNQFQKTRSVKLFYLTFST